MNSAIYRDNVAVAERRRDVALARWRAELADLPRTVTQVYARRAARASAGVTAVVVASQTIVVALTGSGRGATRLLLLAGPLAALVYLAARILAPLRLRALLRRAGRGTGDVWADLARFERSSPLS